MVRDEGETRRMYRVLKIQEEIIILTAVKMILYHFNK